MKVENQQSAHRFAAARNIGAKQRVSEVSIRGADERVSKNKGNKTARHLGIASEDKHVLLALKVKRGLCFVISPLEHFGDGDIVMEVVEVALDIGQVGNTLLAILRSHLGSIAVDHSALSVLRRTLASCSHSDFLDPLTTCESLYRLGSCS
eukprot:3201817-Rhodomonas_salina.1